MTMPAPRSSMPPITERASMNGAVRLTRITSSNASGSVSASKGKGVEPRVEALLTSTSPCPNRASAVGGVGDVGRHGQHLGAEQPALRGDCLERRLAAGAQSQSRALAGEEQRDGLPQPLRSAGDQGDLALQLVHGHMVPSATLVRIGPRTG